MQYLASLDYDHLDNGVFLTALARSISQQEGVRPILLHGESSYTERIIQTGVMREDATIRSIKDLNHRLIALLADEGVATIGLNGYQRKFITLQNDTLSLDRNFFDSLPGEAALLISTLVYETGSNKPQAVPLPRLGAFLQQALDIEHHFIFSATDSDELFTKKEKPTEIKFEEMDEAFRKSYIPPEFHQFGHPLHLTTAAEFHRIPELDKSTFLN